VAATTPSAAAAFSSCFSHISGGGWPPDVSILVSPRASPINWLCHRTWPLAGGDSTAPPSSPRPRSTARCGAVPGRQWRGFQRARGAGGGGGGGGGGWREPDRGAVRQIQGHCHRGEPRALVTTVPRPPAVMALFRGRLQMPLSEFGPALRRTRWGSGRGTAQPVAAPSPRSLG